MVEHKGYTSIFQVFCKDAEWVHVVGDFNHWSPHATPMRQIKPGVWRVELRLPPGEYRFRYLTSNQGWITDWAAFGVERNRFGEWDSLLHVPVHSKWANIEDPLLAPFAISSAPHPAPASASSSGRRHGPSALSDSDQERVGDYHVPATVDAA